MPGLLDDTLKHLTELSPRDWVARGGWPAEAATVIDADIATITGAADKVIRVEGPPDWLLSIDFQSGHNSAAKLHDLLLYNSAVFGDRRSGKRWNGTNDRTTMGGGALCKPSMRSSRPRPCCLDPT